MPEAAAPSSGSKPSRTLPSGASGVTVTDTVVSRSPARHVRVPVTEEVTAAAVKVPSSSTVPSPSETDHWKQSSWAVRL